jgi:pre-60S factor REI1
LIQQESTAYFAECRACGKTFASSGAEQQHAQSKKHKERMQAIATGDKKPAKSEPKTLTVEEQEAKKAHKEAQFISPQGQTEAELAAFIEQQIKNAPRLSPDHDCLFCTHKSTDLDANMAHMREEHSFFVPDTEYLTDMRGLIKYLGEKISVTNVCLHCNGRGRGLRSMEAVRQHMVDKGHTMIAYETEDDLADYADFYDFSSLDTQAVESSIELGDSEFELVLPSGAKIGHRSLRQYYKQHFHPQVEERESTVIHKLLTQYTQEETDRNRSDARALTLMSGFQRKQATGTKDHDHHRQFDVRIGQSNNKLQRHFRAQILF